MNFRPVLLWSDVLVWGVLFTTLFLFYKVRRNIPLRAAWRRVGQSAQGMAAATVLAGFVLIGLLDSLHYQPFLANADKTASVAYAVEVCSLLDVLAKPLRDRVEKTYSAPLATRSFAKEVREIITSDEVRLIAREFPRLRYGGAHLESEDQHTRDVLLTLLKAALYAVLIWLVLGAVGVWLLARGHSIPWPVALKRVWRGETTLAWRALWFSSGALLVCAVPLLMLCVNYHVFGTDKVGQDVFYQILKSIRTGLLIGLLTTLVTLPLAILLGVLAGYFRGWVDDVIQYIYTTLSSIPSVLLIAASVLMMQVLIDTHPEWFASAAERADLRLLALCCILGLTSWTSLCRLLRAETLKLRELDYIQAAQAFGISDGRILLRHIVPNLMHLIIIALAMDFSGLVLAEAVLSYVGIGVDPSMISFGTMINNARMELSREPMVWWSLLASFSFMLVLVLAANLFADTLREAFDPRQ